VVYWGFFTFSDNLARVRVRRLINGHGARQPTDAKTAMQILSIAAEAVSQGHLGSALGAFSDVSQLGQTPFASKIVAFLCPSRAGVFDKRIRDGLRTNGFLPHLHMGIGSVAHIVIQTAFESWCALLSAMALAMNEGIDAGEHWLWTENPTYWRALDVERGLFSMFGANRLGISPSTLGTGEERPRVAGQPTDEPEARSGTARA